MRAENEKTALSYLLGRVSGDERAEIERRYFSDDELFEEIQAMEGELIRDYLRKDLPHEQLADFEARYMTIPSLRRKVDQARTMNASFQPVSGAKRFRLSDLFRAPVFAWSLSGTVSLASLGLAVWFGAQNSSLRQDAYRLRSELAHKGPSVAAFLLSPGAVRGAEGGSHQLLIPAGIDLIQLNLDIPKITRYTRYRATVRTVDRKEVTSQEAVRNGTSVRITLPAPSLQADDYVLTLTGLGPTGSYEDLDSYSFRILHK